MLKSLRINMLQQTQIMEWRWEYVVVSWLVAISLKDKTHPLQMLGLLLLTNLARSLVFLVPQPLMW